MPLISTLKNFWSPEKKAGQLYEEIGEQRIKIKSLLKEYRNLHKEHQEYTDTLEALTRSMSAMIWKKDENHRYKFCNSIHCSNFFMYADMAPCLEFVTGKTDEELVKLIYRDAGIGNTFGEICTLSDDYTKKELRQCHFMEAGVVSGQEVLLYVVKTPLVADGTFKGTMGIGWDMSRLAGFLIGQIQTWLCRGQANILYSGDQVFAYEVKPNANKCHIFQHICPNISKDGIPACTENGVCSKCNQAECIDQ